MSEAMKRLACLLGRHSWTRRIDHGEEFSVCSICGKEKKGGGSGGGATREHVWDRTAGGGPN
jgi:hypothetical protein